MAIFDFVAAGDISQTHLVKATDFLPGRKFYITISQDKNKVAAVVSSFLLGQFERLNYLLSQSAIMQLCSKRKRKRSDSVLWQKPLHQQKCQKGKITTQTMPQKKGKFSNKWIVMTILISINHCSCEHKRFTSLRKIHSWHISHGPLNIVCLNEIWIRINLIL